MSMLNITKMNRGANNSEGQFIQLFHVFLPGTESNLTDRFSVLKELYESGTEYHPIVLKAIRGCFAIEHVHRMGGAEMFGFKELHDYRPSDRDIDDY